MILASTIMLYGVLCAFIIPLIYSITNNQIHKDANSETQPIYLFLSQWLALILVMVFLTIGFFKNRDQHSKNVSYLLTGILIIFLYALKGPIFYSIFL